MVYNKAIGIHIKTQFDLPIPILICGKIYSIFLLTNEFYTTEVIWKTSNQSCLHSFAMKNKLIIDDFFEILSNLYLLIYVLRSHFQQQNLATPKLKSIRLCGFHLDAPKDISVVFHAQWERNVSEKLNENNVSRYSHFAQFKWDNLTLLQFSVSCHNIAIL